MTHYLPIENIENRYTKLMNEIVSQHVDCMYYPDVRTYEIEKGEFLDIERTIEFKALQIAMVSKAFQRGDIKNGDWFLVGDIFYPGIESIKYMAELQGMRVNIAGFNYAGRSDPFDFVQQLGQWSDNAEVSYHKVCDKIFVGSEFHKQNVAEYLFVDREKIIVTGYVWDIDLAFSIFPTMLEKKEQVVWPHRICTEKGVDEFFYIANENEDWNFVVTGNKTPKIELPENVKFVLCKTKKEYYKILSESKYYLSTAYQETFGYTLREALMYDCRIVVPDRLCYQEMIPNENRYKHPDEVTYLLGNVKLCSTDIKYQYDKNIDKIINELK